MWPKGEKKAAADRRSSLALALALAKTMPEHLHVSLCQSAQSRASLTGRGDERDAKRQRADTHMQAAVLERQPLLTRAGRRSAPAGGGGPRSPADLSVPGRNWRRPAGGRGRPWPSCSSAREPTWTPNRPAIKRPREAPMWPSRSCPYIANTWPLQPPIFDCQPRHGHGECGPDARQTHRTTPGGGTGSTRVLCYM